MIHLIARIAVSVFALLLVAHFYSGIVVSSLTAAIVAAVVLGLLNALVRPLLIILTIPITILTLGLFIIIINAALFSLAATLVEGFAVQGFMSAIIGSILVSIVSTVGNRFIS